MAETPLANGSEPRRLPTLAWVAGAVALTMTAIIVVILHFTHASSVVDEPLAIPAAIPAAAPLEQPAAPAIAPAAAPTTQRHVAHKTVRIRGRSRGR